MEITMASPHRRFHDTRLRLFCCALLAALISDPSIAAGPPPTELTANCGSEANCKCSVALNNVAQGLPYSQADIDANKGPEDPLTMFSGGGSENIPVLCRTAKYLLDHNSTWLERYFDVQFQLHLVPQFGNEAFSSVYTSQVVGSVITALQHARVRNHSALVAKASQFLRAYWSISALAAIPRTHTADAAFNRSGNPVVESVTANNTGFNLGLVGMRAYVNGIGASPTSAPGDGLQGVLLSMALEHPERKFTWSLDNSPGYYGGLRAAILTAGYTLNAAGKLTAALNSRSVPPEVFGLSAGERTALSNFVNSGGTTGLSTVTGYLAQVRLKCDLSIVRTSAGVLTWWGRSDARVPVCPSGKGGTWAVGEILQADGVAAFLSRTTDNWGQVNRGDVWRDGASVCNESPGLPQFCFQIPNGTFRHELRIGPSGGVQCVAGCGGTPPPPPCPYERGTEGAAELAPCFPPA
jgi:hypothetical protein